MTLKNHLKRTLCLSLMFISILIGCKKGEEETKEKKQTQTAITGIMERHQKISNLSKLNVAFDLVEDLFYDKNGLSISNEKFIGLVNSDSLIKKHLQSIDTSFRHDKSSKSMIYQAIISNTYLNKKHTSAKVNYHRQIILAYRGVLVEKLISENTLSIHEIVLEYANASFYSKQKLKQDYNEIKRAESAIVKKTRNRVLRIEKNKNSSRNTQNFGQSIYRVDIIGPDGYQHFFECSSDTYILDAAEEAGHTLPFSSRSGADGSAAGRIISGTVNQSDGSFLSDCQIANGFVLLDVAYPTSDVVILTHQEGRLGEKCLDEVIITPPNNPGNPNYPFPPDWNPNPGNPSNPGNPNYPNPGNPEIPTNPNPTEPKNCNELYSLIYPILRSGDEFECAPSYNTNLNPNSYPVFNSAQDFSNHRDLSMSNTTQEWETTIINNDERILYFRSITNWTPPVGDEIFVKIKRNKSTGLWEVEHIMGDNWGWSLHMEFEYLTHTANTANNVIRLDIYGKRHYKVLIKDFLTLFSTNSNFRININNITGQATSFVRL